MTTNARFSEAVGQITGLTDWLLSDEQLKETLQNLHERVSAEEMETIAQGFWGVYRNAIVVSRR